MKLIKPHLFFLIVTFLVSVGSTGCYIQFASVSDDQASADDSPAYNNQPVPVDPYPWPIPPDPYPGPHRPDYPHSAPVLPLAGAASQGTKENSLISSPHREAGDQRSSSGQNHTRQSESTPSRTSWSPAPAIPTSAPSTNPSTPAQTTGSTHRR